MHRARAFLSVMAGCVALGLTGQQGVAAVDVGQPAPPLSATELNGQGFDLNTLRGRVVIVNFWATWCVPCRQEMPALDAFYRQYHAQGLDMIGISADRPRDRSDVVKVMQGYAYPATMLRDATVNGFGTPEALPETFVIDQTGVVRAKFRPDQLGVTEQSLDAAVLPLLPRKANR
jgi:cytochrome c biogenesis protein CcmG, thiol:disulfide interchange protein DsbE